MALTLTEQLDTLYTTTWQNMRAKAVDNIFTATPFWYWLYKNGRIRRESGGRWIGQPLMYAKNTTVKSLAPGGKITISNTDPLTTAAFNWKLIAGSVVRLHSDDTENTGKNAIMSLADAKLKNLELSMIDALETQAFGDGTGNGGLDFEGLGLLVSATPTVGTVGGINRATAANSWWRNIYRSKDDTGMATGDNTYAFNFRKLYNSISIGNDHPTLGLCALDVYEGYESYLVPLLRVYDAALGDVGFEALKFKAMALTHSPSAPSGGTHMLNERYMSLVVNSNADFTMTDWKPIPDQLDRVAQVVLKGNITISNSRMQGYVAGW
jgi:hypothetical protein